MLRRMVFALVTLLFGTTAGWANQIVQVHDFSGLSLVDFCGTGPGCASDLWGDVFARFHTARAMGISPDALVGATWHFQGHIDVEGYFNFAPTSPLTGRIASIFPRTGPSLPLPGVGLIPGDLMGVWADVFCTESPCSVFAENAFDVTFNATDFDPLLFGGPLDGDSGFVSVELTLAATPLIDGGPIMQFGFVRSSFRDFTLSLTYDVPEPSTLLLLAVTALAALLTLRARGGRAH